MFNGEKKIDFAFVRKKTLRYNGQNYENIISVLSSH